MRKLKYTTICAAAVVFAACGFLDVDPNDKVSAEAVVSSPAGIEAFLANLYYQMPIEAFDFSPKTDPDDGGTTYYQSFHYNASNPNNNARYAWILTDDCTGSQLDEIPGTGDYGWWEPAYELLNNVNSFFALIPTFTSVDDATRNELTGQAWFIRGQVYLALARRYGGVCIIEEVGDIDDVESLNVPRSTEVETWDYVLNCFDKAAQYLSEEDNGYRTMANKWAALAYKSRAALHAASLAKYWNKAPLSGDAVSQGLVGGFSMADQERYYRACLSASEEIINSGRFSLYMSEPATPEEAAENYAHMFSKPEDATVESIFVRGFTKKGALFGTNQDSWCNPAQTGGAWPHPGRCNPSLEYAENFETYDNPGNSVKFVTYGGDAYDYTGYMPSRAYRKFSDPLEMFAGKDARLAATTILPGSIWKNTRIVIQGGVITMSGEIKMDVDGDIKAVYPGWDGKNHYQFGAADNKFFSGFSTNLGNNTRTGFGFRKYLSPSYTSSGSVWNESTTDWIDIRFAEILLNYAEAQAESSLGSDELATACLNRTRRRAGHTTEIPLTLENVLRERRAELSLENARVWDLIRRREYHTVFDGYRRGSLTPVLDLRDGKYIFVREKVQKTNNKIFQTMLYYNSIPGISSNGLVQNPQY